MTARSQILTIFLGLLLHGAVYGQDVTVREPDVCLQCHGEFADLAKKPHVHAVFGQGKCSSCHNPHASRHAALLNEDRRELCLECHRDVFDSAGGMTMHGPAGDGDCLACHEPHASDNAHLLIQPMEKLCISCHPAATSWLSRAYVHDPVRTGKCLSCHGPHAGVGEGLLKSAMPSVCFSCHQQDSRFRQAHAGYQLAGANCITCHDPHASSMASLVMPNQHAPFKGKNCQACHAEGDSGFALRDDVKTVCVRCHGAYGKMAEQPRAHNLNDPRSCLNCHNPHASSETALLAGPQTVVCLKCHFKEDKYAGKTTDQILTHDKMDCTNCHEPHGSPAANYFVTDEVSLCSQCHEKAHRTSHPIGPDVIDPRTGKPVTCLSCHQLHGPNFEPYLPLNPEMDLCIQCHRR